MFLLVLRHGIFFLEGRILALLGPNSSPTFPPTSSACNTVFKRFTSRSPESKYCSIYYCDVNYLRDDQKPNLLILHLNVQSVLRLACFAFHCA